MTVEIALAIETINVLVNSLAASVTIAIPAAVSDDDGVGQGGTVHDGMLSMVATERRLETRISKSTLESGTKFANAVELRSLPIKTRFESRVWNVLT